mgnify:FL=1
MQNPFGIGYASVVAAARSILQTGNEALVDTGYVWVTNENMEDASIKICSINRRDSSYVVGEEDHKVFSDGLRYD